MLFRLVHPSAVLLFSCGVLTLAGCGKPAGAVSDPVEISTSLQVKEPPHEPKKDPPPLAVAAKVDKEDGFPFPTDRGGQLLGKLLPPSDKTTPSSTAPPQPLPLQGPPSIERPSLPLPASNAPPPRLPLARGLGTRPGPLADETLQTGMPRPYTPAVPNLSAGERVREPSTHVNLPLALPSLAQLVPDRASLSDPTVVASATAALAAPPAERSGPAPFLRHRLPEPFEHRQTIPKEVIPSEETTPSTGSPRLPSR